MTAVNVGIIGLGFMGATHAAVYVKLPGTQIGAVCSRNAQRLSGDFSSVGGNLGSPLPNVDFSRAARYQTWEELIADPAVDAVDICTPTELHQPITTAALSAGKHVFCEKPMALTGAECDLMLQAANESGRILMIGYVLRFWPAYEFLRNWIASGDCGTVQAATFTRVTGLPDWSSWLPDTTRSGGALFDLLTHDVDQALLLFGAPARISASSTPGYDCTAATMLYADGLQVRVEGGWMDSGTPFSMGFQVQGSRAMLEFANGNLTMADDAGMRAIELPQADAYEKQLSYFLHCCATGSKPERCPPESSVAAVRLAQLLQQSRELDGKELECVL